MILCLTLLAVTATAHAHFLLNLNVRILHVEHLVDGLQVFLRTPMPYLVADRVGSVGSNGLPQPAPYTTNAIEDGKLVHYLDFDQLRRNPEGLGSFAGDGFQFVVDGELLEAKVEQVRVYRVGTQPDFATLDEARTAFTAGPTLPETTSPLYVGDAVVDVVLSYRVGASIPNYAISSILDPGLPGQENTANLILDYGSGGTKVFRARGLLAEPIIISRSTFSAVITFIKEGIRHILEGLDHVLFVLCLVLGAVQLKSLIWRVTGFTIGHSITLTVGFFGFVPSGAWFVPTVEAAIALSIIYAAAIAVMPDKGATTNERNMFMVTSAIGLLHGLGFSFVLHKILQVTSPDIWQSLLAFNVGVEIGQLAIILATWPVFRFIQRLSANAWRLGRIGIATVCIAVAALWTGQRFISVIGTL
ncbi:MAG: HupE/UreJ family protein [Arenicellales bacterium]|nr:HupE/UreJ family protein [Arenicellales bacterium]